MDISMDIWTERLSEYIDGDLDASEASSLEQHLLVCAGCSAIVTDLRAITAHAAALQPTNPARDLWAGINAQIQTGTNSQIQGGQVIEMNTRRTPRRSFTFSMPELAAAAVVLLALGGTAVWQLKPASNTSRVATTTVIPQSSGTFRNVSAGANAQLPILGYDAAIQQLEQAAAYNSGQLDPKTTQVIGQSMATIDRAIADARAALAADPANAYLHRHLDRTMKQKMELLKQAAKMNRGGA